MHLKLFNCLAIPLMLHNSIVALQCQSVIIISTDGFRWQELFSGADSSLLFNKKFVADTSITSAMYWDNNANQHRKKLLPFIWNNIEKKGQ